jgi:hypothetical protein
MIAALMMQKEGKITTQRLSEKWMPPRDSKREYYVQKETSCADNENQSQ